MTTYEPEAKKRELPWPFTGREDERERVRGALAAGRRGLVVTGPAGSGKTRLVTEAVRGTPCARVTGTPEARGIPFAAFAHLLPEPATLHGAIRLLSGVRLLLVDDAHHLDDASAALVHQLAAHGRTRLLVVATDGAPAPGAVTRLWTGELLPRLALDALPREDTADLLTAGAGRTLEPLTVNRLHHLCRGDLRLLRALLDAVRDHGLLARVPGTDEWAWRGPVPLTAPLREHTGRLLGRPDPAERDTLDRLAFAEPLPLDGRPATPAADDPAATTAAPAGDDSTLRVLERLESDGLVRVDDDGAVRLAHPLYGPVLRAAAGRLRARRLSGPPGRCRPALDAEAAALEAAVERADVRHTPAPVGEWLAAEGTEPLPPGYAAVRARFARLRGELREAAAWAKEGLRHTGDNPACRAELALATAQSDDATGVPAAPRPPGAHPHTTDPYGPYDAVRLGAPERAAGRLTGVFAAHADALTRGDAHALVRAADELERRGFLLFAAEANAQAAVLHRDPSAARTARARAASLARRCQGARTPALSGLVLGELTARQRQIVALAAAGLTNRQIAEHLTLSVRTVGNHLYSAYTRLGSGDRTALPCLIRLPESRTA